MARLPQFRDPIPVPFRAGPIFGWLGGPVSDPDAPEALIEADDYDALRLLDEADYEGIE